MPNWVSWEFNCASPTSLACRPKPRRPSPLPCSPFKAGTGNRRTSHPQPAQTVPLFWAKFLMLEVRRPILSLLLCLLVWPALSCSSKPSPDTLVMIIESSPTNLDPRVGIDAFSERIDTLLFDDLLTRDEHFNVQPGLAERWEIPDPLTYIFHLHRRVRFHDGRPLTSKDVKWTFDSLLQGKVRSTKSGVYRFVDHIEAPDDY